MEKTEGERARCRGMKTPAQRSSPRNSGRKEPGNAAPSNKAPTAVRPEKDSRDDARRKPAANSLLSRAHARANFIDAIGPCAFIFAAIRHGHSAISRFGPLGPIKLLHSQARGTRIVAEFPASFQLALELFER